MAKPTSKPAHLELPDVADLTPAPDNGVHPAEPAPAPAAPAAPAKPTAAGGRSRQLGPRVSEELYERLQRCCAETGVPQNFLIQRALEAELEKRGY